LIVIGWGFDFAVNYGFSCVGKDSTFFSWTVDEAGKIRGLETEGDNCESKASASN
jgi:hypothetical protein